MTKFGVIGFSESLRQEVASDGIRIALIEPGLVATEATTTGPLAARFAGAPSIEAEMVAEAIVYALPRPPHVSLNEIVIRPTAARS